MTATRPARMTTQVARRSGAGESRAEESVLEAVRGRNYRLFRRRVAAVATACAETTAAATTVLQELPATVKSRTAAAEPHAVVQPRAAAVKPRAIVTGASLAAASALSPKIPAVYAPRGSACDDNMQYLAL